MLSSTSTREAGHNCCEFNDNKTLRKLKVRKQLKVKIVKAIKELIIKTEWYQ